MSNSEELTYYEYWLTKESWPFEWAIRLIADYVKFKRSWDVSDNYGKFIDGFIDKITSQIINDRAKQVFTEVGFNPRGEGMSVDRLSKEHFVPERSSVLPGEFIKWAFSKGYPIPYEFKVFIGVEEKAEKVTPKKEEAIDRAVCQGIGRTLWDLYPKMTAEEMQYHKAIQVYGGGRYQEGEDTVKRWLRPVDPRTVKTGPKKK